MLIIVLITQTLCILMVSAGIAVEYLYEAHIGFLLITMGSLIFAISTKIESYLIKHRKEK